MIDNKEFKMLYNRLLELKLITSITDFAEKIGSNRSSISQILHDKWRVTNKMLDKIYIAFPELTQTQQTPNSSINNNIELIMMQKLKIETELQRKIINLHEENSRLKDIIIELQKK